MIQHYAAVEDAVTETLVHLGGGRPGKKLPHLAGQRREALRKALNAGAADDQVKAALCALDRFETIADRRTFLCHGHEQVLADHRRRWHLHLSVRAANGDADDQMSWVISKEESERLLPLLNAAARRVIDRLANLRRVIAIPSES